VGVGTSPAQKGRDRWRNRPSKNSVSSPALSVPVRLTKPMTTEGPSPYRRKRGTVVKPVRAGWEIELRTKERVDSLARHLKVSPSYFVEQLVDHIEVDLRGVPTWWPQRELEDGEMPIEPG
jgi:hypothetical protein